MMEVASISIGAVLIVLIVFASLLAALVIVSWTMVRLVGGGARRARGAADEGRLIQEIYQGLTKMERRVEALETLLLERDGKGRP
jgi:phage shock protein B